MAECAVGTSKGTKVADVAWATAATFAQIRGATEASVAPEVCVEVVSQSNSKCEMQRKRKLYFEQGAQEVWICDEYGNLSFFDVRGVLKQSNLFPEFPPSVSHK